MPQMHSIVQVGYGVHVLAAGAASRHRRATPAPPGPAPGLWEPSRGERKTDPGGCVRAAPVGCRASAARFGGAVFRLRTHPHRTKNWQWGIKELM